MAGVKLSAAELEGAVEIPPPAAAPTGGSAAPVQLSAADLDGAVELPAASAKPDTAAAPKAKDLSGTPVVDKKTGMTVVVPIGQEAPKNTEPLPVPGPGVQALYAGAGQGMTMGFGDEITAGVKAGAGKVPGVGKWLGLDDPSKKYTDYRDESRAYLEATRKESPKMFTAGELLGGSMVPMPGLSGGTTLLAKVGRGALAGAGQGAVSGLGYSEADLAKGDIRGAAVAAGTGLGVGGIMGGAVPAVAAGAKVIGNEIHRGLKSGMLSAAEKRVAEQGIADIVGTNDPLVGSATITDRKKLVAAMKLDRTTEDAHGALGKELIRPEVREITDLARTDPNEASAKLNAYVNEVHSPVKQDYELIDHHSGGFKVGTVHRDILSHVKDISRPANETAEKEFRKLADSIKSKWGKTELVRVRGDGPRPDGDIILHDVVRIKKTLDTKRPTSDLRQLVTDLQNSASDTLGSLKESEAYQLRQELGMVAKKSLDKHLDAVAEKNPELAGAVDRIRESNKRVFALLQIQDALATRAIKTETASTTRTATKAAGQMAGATLGTGVGAAIGHVVGGVPGAMVGGGVGGAVGGIAGRAVGAPTVRGVQAVDRALARIALAKLQDPSMGETVKAAVAAALKQGVPQASIDNTLKKLDRK